MNNKLFLLFIFLISFGTFVYFTSTRQNKLNNADTLSKIVETDSNKNKSNQKLIDQLRDAAKISFVKSVAYKKGQRQNFTCFNPHKQAVPLTTYPQIEKSISAAQTIEYLCYSDSLKTGYLLSSRIIGSNTKNATADINLFEFETTSGKLTDLGQIAAGDYLGGCGEIVDFSVNSYVDFRCGWGKDNWSKSFIYRYDLKTKTTQGTNFCSYQADKSYCLSYCDRQTSCASNSICNSATNSCLKTCKTNADCLNQSCQPFGNSLVCQ